MTVLKMTDLDLSGKRVLIREDLNVPVKDGVVKSDARILASLPTIKLALEKGAAVMVCSHLGRPEEGVYSEEDSLKPVADYLSKALGREVPLIKDYLGGVEVQPGELVLLENVRFNKGEKKNTDELAQQYAALCDVFVMDAFGTAHRAQAPPMAWPSSPRSPAPARCWRLSWTRWARRWTSHSGQWWPSLPAPRCRPSWMCSTASARSATS